MFSQKLRAQIDDAFEARFAVTPKPDGMEKNFADIQSQPDDYEYKAAYEYCLKYIYAFMPISDMAAYDHDIYINIVRQALFVQTQNLWNEKIPEAIWLNNVLQYRINNENIEFNREYFFDELYERIQNKTSEEAVIEINYWCLEKLTYTGSSMRTLAPFALVKSTMGRCGEESVFTVSALRSVGIPARQIYTPRWAHCDSNHAWVEVYIGGRWRFLGACEPEPVLDKGWFTYPASRGLLIYARVFSTIPSEGDEVVYYTGVTHEVNRTGFYGQNPVFFSANVLNGNQNVKVHLCMVNSNFMAPFVSLTPDESGKIGLTIGRGDIYLHVTDGVRLITRKVDTRLENTVTVDFSNATEFETGNISMILTPPFSDYKDPDYGFTPEAFTAHKEREAQCHEIRKAFSATFANEDQGKALAQKYGMGEDCAEIFINAKGNLGEIIKFLDMTSMIPIQNRIALLKTLPPKDMLDCEAVILAEHLVHSMPYADKYTADIFNQFILNPRIDVEMLSQYRVDIAEFFGSHLKDSFINDPKKVWSWIEKNIKTDTGYDYTTSNDHNSLSPFPSVLLAYGLGSEHGKKVFFVAICRTFGIPARLNYGGVLEYYADGWNKLTEITSPKMFNLTINGEDLQFFRNFVISKLNNGLYGFYSLFGGMGRRGRGAEAPSVAGTHSVESGHYRILTGVRLADGSMSINLYHITVDGDTVVEVTVPKATGGLPKIDVSSVSSRLTAPSSQFTLLAYVEPANEPTEHLFRELLSAKDALSSKNIGIALITDRTNDSLENMKKTLANLTISDNVKLGEEFAKALNFDADNTPIVALVNKNGEAVYYTHGYHVGSVQMAIVNAE